MPAELPPSDLIGPLLIVDDDQDAHFLLKRALAKLAVGLPVHGVFGGAEAIAYFERCVAGTSALPALVFLDIKMPGRDGFDVLDWLRERQLLGRMTVAMLSSSDDPADVRRAMSLGAHTVLRKPTGNDMLLEVASTALQFAAMRRTR